MAFQSRFGPGVANMGVADAIGQLGALHGFIPLKQYTQRRQPEQVGGSPSNLGNSRDTPGLLPATVPNAAPPPNITKGRYVPSRIDLPGLVQQVSFAATQLAHRGIPSI